MRTLRRVAAAAALAMVLVFSGGVAAFANPDWSGEQDNGGVDVGGEDGGGNAGGGDGGVGSIKVPVPGPWTQRVYTPACDRNSVQANGPGVRDYETVNDVMCEAFQTCPAEGAYRYFVFERAMGADNRATEDNFSHAGTVCRTTPDSSEGEPPVITVADIMEQARALAPTPTFVIEPAATSYVNIPTNFAAQSAPVTVTVTVLGLSIPVEFVPGDVRWSFGDGGSATGAGIENASVGQSGSVEHVYARSGAYDVTVTVPYDARILIPGGDPITFPTPIERTAAPQALQVGEIQSVVTDIN